MTDQQESKSEEAEAKPAEEAEAKPTELTFAEFLETTPPSRNTTITDLTKKEIYNGGGIKGYMLSKPELQLHCSSQECNGLRFFRCTNRDVIYISDDIPKKIYLSYICSNCRKRVKTYSLNMRRAHDEIHGTCFKYGEDPPYGPPVPPKLISLIGPDRDLFLKGRRCENQGLGIGAFVYYRRVVENQKNRILDKIIKVSQKLKAPEGSIKILEAAKAETQFSKALEDVKDAIPEALLVNGHNPLSLLHSALSDGLHARDEDHCLEVAHDVRIVLAELSDRLSQALKDEEELNSALARLMKAKGT